MGATTIRTFHHQDWGKVKEIITKHDFDLPARTNIITEATIVDGADAVVAYGMVRAYAEAVMILDPQQSKKVKISALSQLMGQAIFGSHAAGFTQIHGFVKNPEFSDVMKKHYGFKKADGECLYLEID